MQAVLCKQAKIQIVLQSRMGHMLGLVVRYVSIQMYKLGLEKAEEPEIKLPTFVGSWRKQESSRKTSTSVSLTMLKILTV